MKVQTLNLDHTEALLDVVFGVIIAVPLTKLPVFVRDALISPDNGIATTIFLLASAIVFSAFYWLEVRHFLEEQKRFNTALGDIGPGSSDGVPIPLALFLLGSLAMMALAAGCLSFAEEGYFRSFIIANLLFWIADLFGTLSLKRTYRPYRSTIAVLQHRHPDVYNWFGGHITSQYYILYGALNTMLFIIYLVLDIVHDGSLSIRVIMAMSLFAVTLFRHLLWRSKLYRWWIVRKSRTLAKEDE